MLVKVNRNKIRSPSDPQSPFCLNQGIKEQLLLPTKRCLMGMLLYCKTNAEQSSLLMVPANTSCFRKPIKVHKAIGRVWRYCCSSETNYPAEHHGNNEVVSDNRRLWCFVSLLLIMLSSQTLQTEIIYAMYCLAMTTPSCTAFNSSYSRTFYKQKLTGFS